MECIQFKSVLYLLLSCTLLLYARVLLLSTQLPNDKIHCIRFNINYLLLINSTINFNTINMSK